MPSIDCLPDEIFFRLVELISQQTGIRIRGKDLDSLKEVIVKQAKKSDFLDYYYLLKETDRSKSEVWQDLLSAITNNESYFFRDKGQFNLLRGKIIPELLQKKQRTKTISICSAGCSTGEEPYSLAMLLQELIPNIEEWQVTILGIDINKNALEKAKKGVYGSWSFRLVEDDIIKRYFTQNNQEYHLKPRVKDWVRFAEVNLVKDNLPSENPPINELDIIICRNVFIYFASEAISSVIEKFYHSLQPDGYLLTGHAELAGHNLSKFTVKAFPESIVYQKSPKTKTISPPISPPVIVREAVKINPLINNLPKVEQKLPIFTPQIQEKPKQQQETVNLEEVEKLMQKKAYSLAIDKLNLFLKSQPKDFKSLQMMAQIYANQGKYPEAINWCKEALKVNSFAVDIHYLLAQIALDQGNQEEAKRLFKQIIYLEPNSFLAYLELSHIYQQEGDEVRSNKLKQNLTDLLKKLPPNTSLPQLGGIKVAELINQL